MTQPDPAQLAALDQAVIDAGRVYAATLMADPPDPTASAAAHAQLEQARQARGYPDA